MKAILVGIFCCLILSSKATLQIQVVAVVVELLKTTEIQTINQLIRSHSSQETQRRMAQEMISLFNIQHLQTLLLLTVSQPPLRMLSIMQDHTNPIGSLLVQCLSPLMTVLTHSQMISSY